MKVAYLFLRSLGFSRIVTAVFYVHKKYSLKMVIVECWSDDNKHFSHDYFVMHYQLLNK